MRQVGALSRHLGAYQGTIKGFFDGPTHAESRDMNTNATPREMLDRMMAEWAKLSQGAKSAAMGRAWAPDPMPPITRKLKIERAK